MRAVFLLLPVIGVCAGVSAAAESPEARIRAIRGRQVEFLVIDKEGNAVPGVQVEVSMTRHRFRFGTAVNAKALNAAAEDDPYKTHLKELFNTAVMENATKWKSWEQPANRAGADSAVGWLRDHRFRLRGHTMVWQCLKYGKQTPPDITAIVEAKDTTRNEYVTRRVMDHIGAVGTHYEGVFEDWDVVNEAVDEHVITDVLQPGKPYTQPAPVADWFKRAKQVVPEARTVLNDYHILVGDFAQHKDDYEAIIAYLLEQGAPLEGIGFQCHYWNGSKVRTQEQLNATLDRFGKFGLPLLITEFDMSGGGWPKGIQARQQAQADFFRLFLTTVFAHPRVETFMVWGFWDGRHWTEDAPFFMKDWTPKKALEVYKDLVFNQWWTEETVATGADGTAGCYCFYGDYDVTLTKDGKSVTVPASVGPQAGRLVFRLQ